MIRTPSEEVQMESMRITTKGVYSTWNVHLPKSFWARRALYSTGILIGIQWSPDSGKRYKLTLHIQGHIG